METFRACEEGFYGSALCLRALRKNPVSRRKRVTIIIPHTRMQQFTSFSAFAHARSPFVSI